MEMKLDGLSDRAVKLSERRILNKMCAIEG